MVCVKPSDVLFCVVPCFLGQGILARERKVLSRFKIEPQRVVILANSPHDVQEARALGFRAKFINHNCWLDDSLFCPRPEIAKDLDAVLVSSPLPVKRPELSSEVRSKAVITYAPYSDELKEQINCSVYYEALTHEEVAKLINRARVGLCLSAREGACYASGEYLLSGLPVVTTPSEGGREQWYTPNNHKLCHPTPESVAQTVKDALDAGFESARIRNEHLEKSRQFRNSFVKLTARLGQEVGLERDWEGIFKEQYFHKMVRFAPTDEVREHLLEMKSKA